MMLWKRICTAQTWQLGVYMACQNCSNPFIHQERFEDFVATLDGQRVEGCDGSFFT